MGPRRFFEVALPEMARRNVATFRNMQGRLCLSVGMAGTWTVHLGNTEKPVSEGPMLEPDLHLFFSEEAFDRLLDSSLDFEEAIAKRAVGYSGDVSLLEKLGYLLASGGNADTVQRDQVPFTRKRI
jgi:hypothetical protein